MEARGNVPTSLCEYQFQMCAVPRLACDELAITRFANDVSVEFENAKEISQNEITLLLGRLEITIYMGLACETNCSLFSMTEALKVVQQANSGLDAT